MIYHIVGCSSTGNIQAKITTHEYEEIIQARDRFLEFLYLEEKFDLLMENYYEYEEEILSLALRHLIFLQNTSRMHNARLSITRRLVNLLSTCRLYLDQSGRHISKALGKNSTIRSNHEVAKSNEYDSNLSYKILEELRNHAQHRGYPFHVITFHSQLVDKKLGNPVVTRIVPKLSVAKLSEEGGFKKKILDELIKTEKKDIDLTPHIRSYIDSIQTIQTKLRKTIEQEVSKSISILRSARDIFELDANNIDRETIWLLRLIVKEHNGGERVEEFAYASIENYDNFLRKNNAHNSLSSRFVSSQIVMPSA